MRSDDHKHFCPKCSFTSLPSEGVTECPKCDTAMRCPVAASVLLLIAAIAGDEVTPVADLHQQRAEKARTN